MTASPGTPHSRPVLVALTPEARTALGGAEHLVDPLPFRVGRESRTPQRAATRVLTDRRRTKARPNNELYLIERGEPSLSREHFLIEHNGTHYVLVDRQSAAGTLVEGVLVGGKQTGGAVHLRDGDVIIAGSSHSPYVFKFRVR